MPEKSGYFRIVENRGIIFIFLSKFLFYIFITLGLLKVVFGYFTSVPKNYVSKVLANERTVIGKKFRGRLMAIYTCAGFLFLLMFGGCMNMIYTASSNKYMFYTTGIRLKSLNTELLSQMNEANVATLDQEIPQSSQLREAGPQKLRQQDRPVRRQEQPARPHRLHEELQHQRL